MEEVALPFVAETTTGRVSAEAQLVRFASPFRPGLRTLTRLAPRTEDLLVAFPALAFALATGYGTSAERHRAMTIIAKGGNLKFAADELGLPWWLRKLPPETFTQALPRLPGGSEFSRRIVNHIPRDAWRCASWFSRVELACDLVDEEFALWIAWRTKNAPRLRDINGIILLAAWAWFSRHPGTFGHQLIRQPFEGLSGFRKSLEEADNWRKRVDLAVILGPGITDTWYQGGGALGFEFSPLRTIDDFLGEAATMHNCLDQYARRIALRTTRVFSIRRDGVTVADIEIGPHDDDSTMPKIEQLRGPYNQRVAPVIWQAAYAWLGAQKPRNLPVTPTGAAAASLTVARTLWEPMRAAAPTGRSGDLLRQFLKSGDVFDPEL